MRSSPAISTDNLHLVRAAFRVVQPQGVPGKGERPDPDTGLSIYSCARPVPRFSRLRLQAQGCGSRGRSTAHFYGHAAAPI